MDRPIEALQVNTRPEDTIVSILGLPRPTGVNLDTASVIVPTQTSLTFILYPLIGRTTVTTTLELTVLNSDFIFLPVKLLVNMPVCFPEAPNPPLSCGTHIEMGNTLLMW